MEKNREFFTETEPKWYVLNTVLTMFATAAAAAVALWFYTKMPGPPIFVLVMVLITCGVMVLVLRKRPAVQLSFEGSRLYIRDSNGENFQVYHVPASDFVLKQNSLEKKTDVGRMQIKKTVFYFYGVKNFEQLRTYIRENFPQ